ncbi:MAG: cyclic nucleotide-binding domain-containing protein [Magnetococcus sp. YQC-3]
MFHATSRELGRHYQAGEVIYRQGDPADRFYVIQQGRVSITRDTSSGRFLLVEPMEGEVFGVVSLFTAGQTRFSTARTLTEARILSVDARTFIARLHEDPSTAFRIVRHLAQRIFDLDHAPPIPLDGEGLYTFSEVAPAPLPTQERRRLKVHDFSVGYHFLVVEDEMEFFSLMRGWLQETEEPSGQVTRLPSHTLTHATTFQQANGLLGQDKYDLILLDLNLADSHGYDETFVRIHARAFDTPIIVFTGMDDDQQAVMAVDDGAQDYLIKGQVNKKTFLHAIYHALSRHRLQYKNDDKKKISRDKNEHKYQFRIFDWSLSAEHRQQTC